VRIGLGSPHPVSGPAMPQSVPLGAGQSPSHPPSSVFGAAGRDGLYQGLGGRALPPYHLTIKIAGDHGKIFWAKGQIVILFFVFNGFVVVLVASKKCVQNVR